MRRTFDEIVADFNSTFEEKKAEYAANSMFKNESDDFIYYSNLSSAVDKEYKEILNGKSLKDLTFSQLKDLNFHELAWIYEGLDWEWEMDCSNIVLCKKIELVRALLLFAADQYDDDALDNAYKFSYNLEDGDPYKLSHNMDRDILNTLHSKYLIDIMTLDRDSEEYYIAAGNLSQMDGDSAVKRSKPVGKYYEGSDYCVNWEYSFGINEKIETFIEYAEAEYFNSSDKINCDSIDFNEIAFDGIYEE